MMMINIQNMKIFLVNEEKNQSDLLYVFETSSMVTVFNHSNEKGLELHDFEDTL
jgi:hypothetical protein